MEALSIFKFWRSAVAGGDNGSEVDQVRNAAFVTDDEETDDEDSLFDLVFKSPGRCAIKGGDEVPKKDVQFLESPRDVFLSKNNDSSSSKPMSPVAILRATPKLKVLMLGFKKTSKCEKAETNGEVKGSPLNHFSKPSKLDGSNRFPAKCKVEEMPAGPFLARDNSLRSKMLKENFDSEASAHVMSSMKSVPKYLKLMKPFYVKASKKTKTAGSVSPSSSPVTVPVNLSPRKFSEGSRVGSFKIVARNLGKIRSATAASVDTPSIQRRDDSLLEQHDGIQGAILHCKKSYGSSSQELSHLFRSSSDPSHENMRATMRNSCEEQKRCSI